MEVIAYIGERYVHANLPFRRIHQELSSQNVSISERHVQNLFRVYLALVGCRNLEAEAVQARLREQGSVVLACDAVWFDDVSPRLYVCRDIISDEILLAARIEHADTENLARFFEPLKALLKVPIVAFVSDKEKALGAAIAAVFPETPHQLCHTHYFKNLVKPMDSDLTRLNGEVRKLLTKVTEFDKKLEKQAASDPEERKLARTICKGIGAVGKSRGGDQLFEPPALRRVNRLLEIRDMVLRAMKRKGSDWPLLATLLAALSLLDPIRELARRIERQVEVIRQIARVLGEEGTGEQISVKLRAYLDTLLAEAPRRGRGAARGHFCQHVSDVSDRFWKGLFHCYDNPSIPRTNNELEQFFSVLKHHYRRTYGRKSTAGGPLESFAPYLLELW